MNDHKSRAPPVTKSNGVLFTLSIIINVLLKQISVKKKEFTLLRGSDLLC